MLGYAVIVLAFIVLVIAVLALVNSLRLYVREPDVRNRPALLSLAVAWAAIGLLFLLTEYLGTLI